MSGSIRHDFYTSLSKSIVDDIQNQAKNYYYGIGRVHKWENGSDQTPANSELIHSYAENKDIRNNLIFYKKINPFEVSLVIPRHQWTNGVVYAQWDHTKNMAGQSFYVMTTENRVYKCLNNNNDVPSTDMPTGNSYGVIKTSDGYVWKYMYSIPLVKYQTFVSANYIPVQNALSDSFYNRGSIDLVKVISSGSGYISSPQTVITLTNEVTTGSGATATIDLLDLNGGIESLNITNGGSAYSKGALVRIQSATGQGAEINPIIENNEIVDFDIINPGFGYTLGDQVSIIVGGAQLLPVISRKDGSILKVEIINPGAGYIATPDINVITTNGVESGIYEGNSKAIIGCAIDNGQIVNVYIIDPGQDHDPDLSTVINVIGDGEDASFIPVIDNGRVIDVVIENAGSNYTSILLQVLGGGTGAVVEPIIKQSNFETDQHIVEQTAIDGAIYSVVITDRGREYTNTTKVSIVGDGDGAKAEAIISNGEIVNVRVTEFGKGYTYASVIFTDPNRIDVNNEIPQAVGYCIISPVGGHGSDAIHELMARALMINSKLTSNVFLNESNQEYRQFNLIKSPRDIQGSLVNAIETTAVFECEFNTTVDLLLDEILTIDDTHKYRVVYIKGNSVGLLPTTKMVSPAGQLLKSVGAQTRIYEVMRVTTTPGVDKYTGELLYTENVQPVVFLGDQNIVLKTIVRF